MASLTGTAIYVYNRTPNTQFKPHKFKIDLMVDEKNAKKAKDMGLKVKPADSGHTEQFIAFSSYIDEDEHLEFIKEHPEGSTKGRKPIVYDANGELFNGIVGNGSKVSVLFTPWKNSSGVKALWRGIVVHELVLPEGFDENYGSDDAIGDEVEALTGRRPQTNTSTEDTSEKPAEAPKTEVDPEFSDDLNDL